MSAIDWVCKKISLESASGQLLAITISCQRVLPSKLDACVNVTTCCCYRVFSHDVTAAILVSQNNVTAAMLVSQTNPLGAVLFSYANAFFCSNKFA